MPNLEQQFQKELKQAINGGATWGDLPQTVQSKIAQNEGTYPEGDRIYQQFREQTYSPEALGALSVQTGEATGGGRIPEKEEGFFEGIMSSIGRAKAKDDTAIEEHGVLGGLRSQMGLTPDAAAAKTAREGPSLYEQDTTDLTAAQILERDERGFGEGPGASGRGMVEVSPEQERMNHAQFNAARERNGKSGVTLGEYRVLSSAQDKAFLEGEEKGEAPEVIAEEFEQVQQTPDVQGAALTGVTQLADQASAPHPTARYEPSDPVNYDRQVPFYQTEAFDTALLSFTMGQILGYSPEQSLQAAAKSYQHRSESQQREAHRDDLLAQGYAPHRVEQWERTGVLNDLGAVADAPQWKQITAPTKDGGGLFSYGGQLYDEAGMNRMGIFPRGATSGAGGQKLSEMEARRKGAAVRSMSLDRELEALGDFPGMTGNFWTRRMDQHAADSRAGKTGFAGTEGAVIARGQLSNQERAFYDLTKAWIETNLRPETGAAISAQEYADWRTAYFPSPSDTAQDIARKKSMRDGMTLVNMSLGGNTNISDQILNAHSRGDITIRNIPGEGIFAVDLQGNPFEKIGE